MLFYFGDLCQRGEEIGVLPLAACQYRPSVLRHTSILRSVKIIHLVSSPGDKVFASPHLLCIIRPFPECHLSVPQPLGRAPGPAPLSCQSSDKLLFPTLNGC